MSIRKGFSSNTFLCENNISRDFLYEKVIIYHFSLLNNLQRRSLYTKNIFSIDFSIRDHDQSWIFCKKKSSTITFLFKKIINDGSSVRKYHMRGLCCTKQYSTLTKRPSMMTSLYETNSNDDFFYSRRSSTVIFLYETIINDNFFYKKRLETILLNVKIINEFFLIRKR